MVVQFNEEERSCVVTRPIGRSATRAQEAIVPQGHATQPLAVHIRTGSASLLL